MIHNDLKLNTSNELLEYTKNLSDESEFILNKIDLNKIIKNKNTTNNDGESIEDKLKKEIIINLEKNFRSK